jgi:hypothetical protein
MLMILIIKQNKNETTTSVNLEIGSIWWKGFLRTTCRNEWLSRKGKKEERVWYQAIFLSS